MAEPLRNDAVAATPSPAPVVEAMTAAPVVVANLLAGFSPESMAALQDAITKVVPAEASENSQKPVLSPMPPQEPPASVEPATASAPIPARVPGDDWLRSSMLHKDDKKSWSLSIRDIQLMHQHTKDHDAIANHDLTRS